MYESIGAIKFPNTTAMTPIIQHRYILVLLEKMTLS